jgi:hypothetical protein
MKAKLFCFTVLLFTGFQVFSQQDKIMKLLNKQLNSELKKYTYDDSLKVLHPFLIDKNNVLSLEVKKYDMYNSEWRIVKQDVPLDKITGFVKDVNVIFETEPDAVTVTVQKFSEAGVLLNKETSNYNLFITEICKDQDNENFRDKILQAFEKTGYDIESRFWAD